MLTALCDKGLRGWEKKEVMAVLKAVYVCKMFNWCPLLFVMPFCNASSDFWEVMFGNFKKGSKETFNGT